MTIFSVYPVRNLSPDKILTKYVEQGFDSAGTTTRNMFDSFLNCRKF